MRRSRLLALLALAALAAGCARPGAPPEPAATPAAALEAVEARLLEAPEVGIRYRARAEGPYRGEISGVLRLRGDEVTLEAEGEFAGEPMRARLSADARGMSGGNGATGFDGPRPEGLREALVVGLVRMGILHNLARLSAGAAPDHADGGVREWVVATDPRWVAPEAEGASAGVGFGITVAGSPAGEAELWLDARGLPLGRRQVVRFPGGEMRVTEEYELLPPGSIP